MNKLIVTGSTGWFGTTFLYNGYKLFGNAFLTNNYFVGSHSREVSVPGINNKINIISIDQIKNIDDASYLVQGAFIARDKIYKMGEKEYLKAIKKILHYNEEIYKNNKNLKGSIMLSSGAVYHKNDLYSILKLEEEDLYKSYNPKHLILRVFGATGNFIKENNWSALSNFLACLANNTNIKIKSKGSIKRSYVDFSDLSLFIIDHLSNCREYENRTLDAVSFTTTVHEIAEFIASQGNIKVIYPKDFNNNYIENNYSSNSKSFLQIAKKRNLKIKGFREAILESIS